MKRYYIAYGSNINIHRMRDRCPTAELLGTAKLKGWELMFKRSMTGAYLTLEEKPGGSVPVVIWSVSAEDEQKLDRCEGYPVCYYKRKIRLEYEGISTGKMRTVKGFTYIMPAGREYGIPSDRYMDICLTGYRIFEFDKRLLYEARRESTRRMIRNMRWGGYEFKK